MGTHTADPVATIPRPHGQSDRRHGNRTPALLSVLYSGMDCGQMLIGDGIVTDFSQGGIGIRGNRSVAPGMEMALFVDLSGREEPLCIAQSRVSWVLEHQFGVELGALTLEDKKQLQFFLRDRVTHSDCEWWHMRLCKDKEVLS